MLLIDSLYINSFGGETILKLLMISLSKIEDKKVYYIFDKRLDNSIYLNLSPENYIVLEPSTFKRKVFYKKNQSKFNSFLCLANIPPPIKIREGRVIIFFHNDLFLNPLTSNLPINLRLNNLLKKLYIVINNKADYIWVVQTYLMKKKLNDNFRIKIKKIEVTPIFSFLKEKNNLEKKINYSFVYISSNEMHKNHKNLIQAFINVAYKINKNLTLHLTIQKDNFKEIDFPDNLEINFHGKISQAKVIELYRETTYSIFPSLNESFGLPLIEAADYGCKVIASDLPYVHEIIEPSLTFDPYSVESISAAIQKAVANDNLPETKVIIENKLDNFIEYILK
jgi:glycosyltransferase involved in cell wall biosynthesis